MNGILTFDVRVRKTDGANGRPFKINYESNKKTVYRKGVAQYWKPRPYSSRNINNRPRAFPQINNRH